MLCLLEYHVYKLCSAITYEAPVRRTTVDYPVFRHTDEP